MRIPAGDDGPSVDHIHRTGDARTRLDPEPLQVTDDLGVAAVHTIVLIIGRAGGSGACAAHQHARCTCRKRE